MKAPEFDKKKNRLVEGRKTNPPKRCEYENKAEDKSPNILDDKNDTFEERDEGKVVIITRLTTLEFFILNET